MLAVIGTAGVWYLGDPVYNDYGSYIRMFGEGPLNAAWWEVLLFFLALAYLVPLMNGKINKNLPVQDSNVIRMMREHSIDEDWFQSQVDAMGKALLVPWILLMTLGLIRSKFDVIGIFFPYLGEKADPWARDRVGGGIDALYAFAIYIQLMMTAMWGVIFALSKRPQTFSMAGIIYFLSAPFYVFDRTRSYMLAILLPGFMALVTLRMRSSMIVRLIVIAVSFIALEGWMKFVIDNRDKGSIASAFKSGGTQDDEVKKRKHGGFNMYQELGYINSFIDHGTYKVNWGSRYFAEIVNPIPRVIWKNKPMIGIDYAIARGMAYGDLDAKSGGIAASISTGMIGQGVVNFGGILGPITSAFLMAVWVALLARLDLMGYRIGYLMLYGLGLVLTYNMGRDITLLILYPLVFGWILLDWYYKRNSPPQPLSARV
jgi:MFS family permease